MPDYKDEPLQRDILIAGACLVIIVAGIKAASGVIVPILLAVFISIMCKGPFAWLKNRKVPSLLAVMIIISFITAAFIALCTYIGVSINEFLQGVPVYQARIQALLDGITSWFLRYGIHIPPRVVDYLDPSSIIQIFANILGGLGNMATWTVLILFMVVFILMESPTFIGKIKTAFTTTPNTLETLDFIFLCIGRYVTIKTLVSLATGLSIMLWLTAVGVDYAGLWGLIAFLMHYIPSIGSLIAAVPAILFSLVDAGPTTAVFAAAGYVVANLVFGNILEPIFMGRGLSLSTLVVFLSLIFWGWVLGPVGMLLSAPLTMVFKIVFDGFPSTRWISVLFDAEAPLPIDLRPPPVDMGEKAAKKS